MDTRCGSDDIEDFTWIFDQAAAGPLTGACDGFVYQPSGRAGSVLPTQAPAGPYATSLDAFNREQANGTWRLFVADGGPNDKGDIELGWTLTVSTGPVDTAIPGNGSSGAASPYALTQTVPSGDTVLLDLDVTIDGIWHERPDDLDLLLVGPGGQKVVLMSDACGSFGVKAFGWRWNDEAAAPMPDGDGSNVCATTSHLPTDHEPGDVWPAPAPGGPYDGSLSVFDATDPAGEWRLYVNDDTRGAHGFLTNRFQLSPVTRPKAPVDFAPGAISIAEGQTRELTIKRSGPPSLGAGSVQVTSVPATASSGADFQPVNTVVDFAPSETEQTLDVSVRSDSDEEAEEAFVLTLGSPSGDAQLGTRTSSTVTIPSQQRPATGPGGAPGRANGQPSRPVLSCAGKPATIVGTPRSDVLRGTRRADVIVALGGSDRIKAGRGNDTVCAGSGKDVVFGQAGKDRLLGGAGADRLVGGAGRDSWRPVSRRDRASCER